MNYLNDEHERKFYQLVAEDNASVYDIERQSLFYIMAGNIDLYQKKKHIYDCNNHCIIRCLGQEEQKVDLSSGAKSLVQLGFNLYNGENQNESSVWDIFASLDNENRILALNAIKLRFLLSKNIRRKIQKIIKCKGWIK
ncbi:MAG: DUF6075 family protein [Lachnotalea sp.]